MFGKPTLDTIADYIVLVQPEAIAFQELDSMTLRSARIYVGKSIRSQGLAGRPNIDDILDELSNSKQELTGMGF
jgi:hypothetical protein